MKIRILLADDHAVVRHGFRMILDSQSDLEVVGEVANGREAVERASEIQPDVVVMDVTMPELNGIEATRRISAACPRTRGRIMEKLNLHSTGELVRFAVRNGLID
jgi:two-component system, NarL family, response regulator NreC